MKLPPLRTASAEDTDAVLNLLRLMRREIDDGPFEEDLVRAMIGECLTRGAIILSLSHGEPVGTLGLSTASFWWSKELFLQDRWTFVHPQHRRAPHARALLEAAKQTAKVAGMPLLMGVMGNIRTAGKVKLFSRIFGAPVGASFLVRN